METVVNEWLRELIDYEWLSVSSFESKVGRKLVVKINHYGNNKSNGKKRALNASESDTRKNGELKGSLKHTLYIASLFEKYQRNTRMKLASALLLCRQCSHRKDFATRTIS